MIQEVQQQWTQASADGRQRVGFTVTTILHKLTYALVAQGQAILLLYSPVKEFYTAVEAFVGVKRCRVTSFISASLTVYQKLHSALLVGLRFVNIRASSSSGCLYSVHVGLVSGPILASACQHTLGSTTSSPS